MKTEEALDNMQHVIDEYKNIVAESRIIKIENDRLTKINEKLTQNIGDAQLALQSNADELKSLRARLADYEHPDELAIKL